MTSARAIEEKNREFLTTLSNIRVVNTGVLPKHDNNRHAEVGLTDEIYGMQNVIKVKDIWSCFKHFIARDNYVYPNLRMIVASIKDVYEFLKPSVLPVAERNQKCCVYDLENYLAKTIITAFSRRGNHKNSESSLLQLLDERNIEDVYWDTVNINLQEMQDCATVIFVTKNKSILGYQFVTEFIHQVCLTKKTFIVRTFIWNWNNHHHRPVEAPGPGFGQLVERPPKQQIKCASLTTLPDSEELDGSMSKTTNHDKCSHDDFVMVVCALFFNPDKVKIHSHDSDLNTTFDAFRTKQSHEILDESVRRLYSKDVCIPQWLLHSSLAHRLKYAPSNRFFLGIVLRDVQYGGGRFYDSTKYFHGYLPPTHTPATCFPWEQELLSHGISLDTLVASPFPIERTTAVAKPQVPASITRIAINILTEVERYPTIERFEKVLFQNSTGFKIFDYTTDTKIRFYDEYYKIMGRRGIDKEKSIQYLEVLRPLLEEKPFRKQAALTLKRFMDDNNLLQKVVEEDSDEDSYEDSGPVGRRGKPTGKSRGKPQTTIKKKQTGNPTGNPTRKPANLRPALNSAAASVAKGTGYRIKKRTRNEHSLIGDLLFYFDSRRR